MPKKRRNTVCISRFFGKGRRKICRQDACGGYWYSFLDLEIVVDLKKAEQIVGEKLFPIGTVEPDGITCAAESGNIYTLFDDSIFLSGDCIEDYLNVLFIHGRKPKQLM